MCQTQIMPSKNNIPESISNHMPSNVLGEITYSFPDFDGSSKVQNDYTLNHRSITPKFVTPWFV